MNNFLEAIDRFKFGILAACLTYIGIFIYLQVPTIDRVYYIDPFLPDAVLEIPEDEIQLRPENIQINKHSAEVKNIARDRNDTRERSMDKWTQNKNIEQVAEDVKDYEKKMFEEAGGAAERERIKREMEQRKLEEENKATNNPTPNTSNGSNTAYAGNVMVEFSLSGREPYQNRMWWVRNPGYTCGYGAGNVTMRIKVNQNGNVTSAVYDPSLSSGANTCMIEKAKEYAMKSRFNYKSGAQLQEGTITYTYISQ